MDVTDDSSMIVGGFADSTVRVWSVTPKKLRSVKSAIGNHTLIVLLTLIIGTYERGSCWERL